MVKKLKDFIFRNKRVLVRSDLDVPIDKDGNIVDDSRLISSLDTIKYLIKNKAKVILMGHMARPKGQVIEKLKFNNVAKALSKLLGKDVKKLDDCVGSIVEKEVNNMNSGEIILLENLRFHIEEELNDSEFSKKLAKLGEIYINDSFANCHRNHSSMVGVPKLIQGCIGYAVENEFEQLNIETPEKPFIAIIGGAKSDKILAVKNLINKVDKIIIGGVLANTFLKANNVNIESSKYDEESLSDASDLLKKFKEKILLPEDYVVAKKIDESVETNMVEIVPKKFMILDIGMKTVEKYMDVLSTAKTIVFGGPLGVFELPQFSIGTKEILSFISNLNSKTITCGGDSIAAVNRFGLKDKFVHVSTGGGASLELISGKKLVAIEALEA